LISKFKHFYRDSRLRFCCKPLFRVEVLHIEVTAETHELTPHTRLYVAEDNNTRWPRRSMRKLGHTHPPHRAPKLGSHAPASSTRSVHLFTYFVEYRQILPQQAVSLPSTVILPCRVRHSLGRSPCSSFRIVLFSPFPWGSAGRICRYLTVFP